MVFFHISIDICVRRWWYRGSVVELCVSRCFGGWILGQSSSPASADGSADGRYTTVSPLGCPVYSYEHSFGSVHMCTLGGQERMCTSLYTSISFQFFFMIYFIALFIFHIYNLHFLFFRKKLCTYVYRHFSVDIYMCITVYNICLYIINFVCFK